MHHFCATCSLPSPFYVQNPATRSEIIALANAGNERELSARLSTRMAFGTAGKKKKRVLHFRTVCAVIRNAHCLSFKACCSGIILFSSANVCFVYGLQSPCVVVHNIAK